MVHWHLGLQLVHMINHLVFHIWVANGHFRSCILLWIFASMDVALRPRASNTPSRSWIKVTVDSARLPGFLDLRMALERWHVVAWFGSCIFTWHLVPRRGKMSLTYSISCEAWLLACGCLVSPPMFLAGVASVGFQLRTRMCASSCFKISSSRAKLLQMVPWMRPSAVDCFLCVLLLGQRLTAAFTSVLSCLRRLLPPAWAS